jgi:hypothetical protein
MRKEITIKKCDICKNTVINFIAEQTFCEYLDISRISQCNTNEDNLDICSKCNDKIIQFINSLDESYGM